MNLKTIKDTAPSSWNRQGGMRGGDKSLLKCYRGKRRHLVVPLFLPRLAFVETSICAKQALAAELGVFTNVLNRHAEIFYCVPLVNMKLVNFQ